MARHRGRLCGKAVRHDRPLVAGFLAGHGDHYYGHLVALDAAYGFEPIWVDPVQCLLCIPALIIGARLSAVLMRMTRSALLEVLREDYVRTARAKGLHERVIILKHALQNAYIPVVTIIGQQFSVLWVAP